MPEPTTPSRDATVTAPCLCCQRPTTSGRGRRYCSPACRQAAYRRRHTTTASPPLPPPGPPLRNSTVYACPDCDTRTVGQQRCEDCNTFTRRLGLGGTCPHCDEPITIDELLDNT